jgi:hypothetical protein
MPVGTIGSLQVNLSYAGDGVDITVRPVTFGGEPVVMHGEQ